MENLDFLERIAELETENKRLRETLEKAEQMSLDHYSGRNWVLIRLLQEQKTNVR